jgi:hypothetical protein
MKSDASSSFGRALDFDPKTELPKSTVPAARRLFAKIKRDLFGDDRPAKKKVRRSKPPPRGESPIETAPPPAETAAADPDPPAEPAEETPLIAAAPPPPALDPPPPPPALEPPLSAGTQVEDSGPNLPAWISIGVGAAALVTAGVLGGVSLYNYSTIDELDYAFDRKNRFDASRVQRNGAFVAGSVGIVGLGLGATFLLID